METNHAAAILGPVSDPPAPRSPSLAGNHTATITPWAMPRLPETYERLGQRRGLRARLKVVVVSESQQADVSDSNEHADACHCE